MVMDSKTAARMRQPMSRGDAHALMAKSLSTILDAMNQLEGRIQALEEAQQQAAAVQPTSSGLVLPVSAR